jgi:predicted NBD/HSP70 family sugar kinase
MTTMTLGVEVRETAATVVAVDRDGRVGARVEHPLTDGPQGLAAAIARLPDVDPSRPVGLAFEADDLEAAAAGATAHRVAAAAPSGTAAAVAEAWIGAARGAADVMYFSAAGHVAAGLARQGRPVRGAHGHGPAVGWMSLNPVERDDYRRFGCLEAEVGGAGIVRRLIWRIKSGDHSSVEDLVDGDLGAVSVEHVFAAARDHDGVAVSVVRDTVRYLGMAAANLLVVADPEVLVLGGLIAAVDDLLLDPVRHEIGRHVPPARLEAVRVVPAALGSDAAAIGAARLLQLD